MTTHLLATLILAALPTGPNPIYPAADSMRLINATANGQLYRIAHPNATTFSVLHAWGGAEEMGEAQGLLLGREAYEFLTVAMPKFYKTLVGSLPLGKLPAWLRELIERAIAAGADTAVDAALAAILDIERPYIGAARIEAEAEQRGLAAGI